MSGDADWPDGEEPWPEPDDAELIEGPRLTVVLTAHARRQLSELGPAAEVALAALAGMSHEEISCSAESLPPQRGREMWMLWAGTVRILFDIEGDDLTVEGFGLRPGW